MEYPATATSALPVGVTVAPTSLARVSNPNNAGGFDEFAFLMPQLAAAMAQAVAIASIYALATEVAAIVSGDEVLLVRGQSLVKMPLASALGLVRVVSTYTASGVIAPADDVSLVNAAASVAMTLAAGAIDGHAIKIKRYGAGAVTVTANIDGASQAIVMSNPDVKESLGLTWNAALSTYFYL